MHRILLAISITFFFNFTFSQSHHDIKIDAGNIHFETFGAGQPMLIINGGPGMNSEGFRGLASILGKNNQAIIYDQRGTGKSTLSNVNAQTITMDNMVKDIETIRAHLKIKEWVVLGHSFGGMLASYYATKHPENIKGLILSSSGGINLDLFSGLDIQSRLSQNEKDSLDYWNAKVNSGDTSYHARYHRGKYLAPAYLYDKSNVEVVAHRLTQGNRRINELVFQNMFSMEFDCEPSLKDFTSPVLIVQGADDIIPVKISEYAHNIFPNSILEVLEKCGHYGWLDRSTAYFSAIADFLDTQVYN